MQHKFFSVQLQRKEILSKTTRSQITVYFAIAKINDATMILRENNE